MTCPKNFNGFMPIPFSVISRQASLSTVEPALDLTFLFGNLRIPAALFAGASAGAAFAMPLDAAEDTLKLGMVKRVYALLMMGALSSQVIVLVVATVTMAALSTTTSSTSSSSSVAEYLRRHCDLEWVTARWHFLSGLLLFAVGSGLRAWVTIGCPVIAAAALGIVLSGTLLALAFIDAGERRQQKQQQQELDDKNSKGLGMLALPGRFVTLLARRAQRWEEGPWFAAAGIAALVTAVYLVAKVGHVYKYLVLTTTTTGA